MLLADANDGVPFLCFALPCIMLLLEKYYDAFQVWIHYEILLYLIGPFGPHIKFNLLD